MNQENKSKFRASHLKIKGILACTLVLALSACSDEQEAIQNCITQAPWELSVSGAGSGNHDQNVNRSKSTFVTGGILTGLAQSTAGREISYTFEVGDLGANGSITLSARTASFPGELVGNAYPVLVELNDGVNNLINLKRTGSGGDCSESGYFTCPDGQCVANQNCTLNSPSAFVDRSHWQQYQIPPYGFVSTNTFPTCHWESGSPGCEFNNQFFSSGKLRRGTYTAKYVLLTSNYQSVGNFVATLEITNIQKRDTDYSNSGGNGALDLNLILVGNKNIEDARSVQGQSNLSSIIEGIQKHYNQNEPGLKLGKVRGYEWSCSESSEFFSNIGILEIGRILREGTSFLPPEVEGNSVNTFMVSTIPYTEQGVTILGVSGAIRGPPINGTAASGFVVATFDRLLTMSPSLPTTVTFTETITHELGHYLGLNHPTEKSGELHDYLPDTPECAATSGVVSHSSCRMASSCLTQCNGIFCPTVSACQFNHAMWYTTKNYDQNSGQSDGNLFSSDTSRVINFGSFIY